jgi:hypothetical protein
MKKLLTLTVGLLILLTSILVNCASATPIQYSGSGHFYDAISVPGGITWEDAKTAAAQCSGHLATITSQDENDFIAANFAINNRWLGGFQPDGSVESNGGWQWITNEPWTYTNWLSGEPNNDYGGELGILPNNSPENALQFWISGDKWNDYPSVVPLNGYIIEYETPADVVRQMITTIQDLVASGELNSVSGKASISVLNVVVKALNTGNTKAATIELKAFIKMIKSYIKGGLISSTEGQKLIDSANVVINAIA